jgi:hypothetical protein
MRPLHTFEELRAQGLSPGAIRWGAQQGRWRRMVSGIYGEGPEDPTELDCARAVVVASGGVASGSLAAVLHDLDGSTLQGADVTLPRGASTHRAGTRHRQLTPERVTLVHGVRCVDGLQILLDIAPDVDDLAWEQALESALRKGLTTIDAVALASETQRRGATRIRRVLALRPPGAPATESMLETLMVQLVRTVPGVPDPVRQRVVVDEHGQFVARVDLAWPELGLFVELDGQQHKGQPVYDARRETAVVAATGWLCGRFTWREVAHLQVATARRLAALVDQARRRPLPP